MSFKITFLKYSVYNQLGKLISRSIPLESVLFQLMSSLFPHYKFPFILIWQKRRMDVLASLALEVFCAPEHARWTGPLSGIGGVLSEDLSRIWMLRDGGERKLTIGLIFGPARGTSHMLIKSMEIWKGKELRDKTRGRPLWNTNNQRHFLKRQPKLVATHSHITQHLSSYIYPSFHFLILLYFSPFSSALELEFFFFSSLWLLYDFIDDHPCESESRLCGLSPEGPE